MKTQIINVLAKAASGIKKYGLPIVAGASAVAEAISEQNKAKQFEDLVNRVTELEKLVNKQ